MMHTQRDVLNQLVSEALMPLGYELWGIDYRQRGRVSLLQIYIDSQAGINIDDCEKASRQISSILDVADPIAGEYTLEVSSPGMDRSLFKIEHYQRYIGYKIKLTTKLPQNGRRNFSGLLITVTGEQVQIEVDNNPITLAYNDIEKAHLWIK